MSQENRSRVYKNNAKDNEELRRRRNETSVSLRKAKKDVMLSKRRNVHSESPVPLGAIDDNKGDSRPKDISEISRGIQDDSNPPYQFQCVQSARKILSKEKHPPINDFIEAKVIPKLVGFLARTDDPKLQLETAWALTNIASGTTVQTRAVLEAGGVPYFIALLSSPDEAVCEQAVWGLGNVAGDGPDMRDYVIQRGILGPLIALIDPRRPVTFLRNVAWVLSNLCRYKDPLPPQEVVKECLPILAKLLFHEDNQITADTCWAISYLSDATNERIQCVIDAGVVPQLVKLLSSTEKSVLTPALRAIGNIVTGTDEQTEVVLAAGGLTPLANLLKSDVMTTVKEATWALSNVAAGKESQIQKMIDENVFGLIIDVLVRGDFKAQKEAVWVVSNLTSCGAEEQKMLLVQSGVIKPLCDLLCAKDEAIVGVILDSIFNILSCYRNTSDVFKVGEAIEECGGLCKIESLQNHANEEIYKKALKIIEAFFAEEEEDLGLAPDQQQNQFQFSNPSEVQSNNGFNF